jgi:hypothetical protein
MCEQIASSVEMHEANGLRILLRGEYRSMKRGVKASPWPALDESLALCYAPAESAMKTEVEAKVERR